MRISSVHPLADQFPMMAEHELAELAVSIADNGLLQPIILKGEVLIDGRNRLKACEIAGVKPRFEQLNGTDEVDFILAVNVARRHLNAGQRAIAYGFAYPKAEHGGKRIKGASLVSKLEFSAARLSQAHRIIDHSRDMAKAIFAGTMHFDKALVEIKASEQAALSEQAKLVRLQEGAPDLAALVSEGMDLDEAIAAMNERERRDRATRQNLFSGISKIVFLHEILGSAANVQNAAAAILGHSEDFETSEHCSVHRLIQACRELPDYLDALRLALSAKTEENSQ